MKTSKISLFSGVVFFHYSSLILYDVCGELLWLFFSLNRHYYFYYFYCVQTSEQFCAVSAQRRCMCNRSCWGIVFLLGCLGYAHQVLVETSWGCSSRVWLSLLDELSFDLCWTCQDKSHAGFFGYYKESAVILQCLLYFPFCVLSAFWNSGFQRTFTQAIFW